MKDYIEALREIKKENKDFKITLSRKEVLELVNEFDRLNNIINELERYLEDEKINLDDYLGCLDGEERHYEIARLRPRYNDFKEIYDKLQELRGTNDTK